ncbi:RluA family pseudouridine synthase [Candidatus Daviesbacteria bacterium]|nr:RluA family pseudouridine synthase [Candidatus Daviesbacteria bacterium]
MENNPYTLQVIYEDEYILVINKPAHLITAKTDTGNQTTIEDLLAKDFKIDTENAGLVHRLDKETSGLLVVAKTPQARANIQDQFKERLVKKEYLALAHGFISEKGEINLAIGRNPFRHDKFSAIEDGRESVTEYEPIEKKAISAQLRSVLKEQLGKQKFKKMEQMNYGKFTYLKCKPKTGRTHQIRVHLKYINHPIVGDSKYGGRKTQKIDSIWCPRQFLHAAKLEFYHPITAGWLEFESDLPEDLVKALNLLGKHQ